MSENQILTQEEKDALQASADTDVALEPQTNYNVVDFAQVQNTTAQYPGLQPILELSLLDCNQQFSKFLHRRISTQLAHFQFDSFGAYCHRFPESSVYTLLHLRSHQLYGLINIPFELLDFSLNILYGGKISPHESAYKNIGKVGLKTINRILKIILSIQQQVWSDITRFDFEIVKTLTNPNIITKIHRNEMFSVIRYQLQLADFSSWFDILIPRSILDQLKNQLKGGDTPNVNRTEENLWQQTLKQEVLNARATIAVKLPDISMTLKDVLNLKVGDVLPITDPREVDICSGEKKLYRGIAGLNDTKRVVKINSHYQN